MSKRTNYMKQYYQEHKEELSKRKKLRYQTDPVYRRRIKIRSKLSTVLKSLSKSKYSTVEHCGRKQRAYYYNQIAALVNRDRTAFYRYIKNGLIPPPLYKDIRGRGLYASDQVQYLQEIFRRIDNDTLYITYKELRPILDKLWNKPFSIIELDKILNEHLKEVKDDKER